MASNTIKTLPPNTKLETKKVFKNLTMAHRALAELKGFSDTIPNKNILINAIILNESKDSSEIENIITTHDELFKELSRENNSDPAAKEVANYRSALWHGYKLVREQKLLTINKILEIQQIIEQNKAGIRKLPGTVLKDDSGKIIYTPPSGESEILDLLKNLEQFINDDSDNLDPLIKLAVIHYQFEAIHPFYDGNGRTGRILNVLYLVLKDLLETPILYLSSYIIRNKSSYYRLLRQVTEKGNWEEWVLFILRGIEETAIETLRLVKQINNTMESTAEEIKQKLPKLYSKELIELIFFEFYTKIGYVEQELKVTRKTASKYLSSLEKIGVLTSEKIGRERIYLNDQLIKIVKEAGQHN